MGFVFRLEKVARYRQQLVDEQGRQVALAERVVTELRLRLVALAEDMNNYLADFQDPGPLSVSVQGLMARTMWVSHLEKLQAEAEVDLAAAEAELAHQRAELTAVWRDLEVLNKLRETQKSAWQEEQKRLENREMDEISQIRADRQHRSKVAC